MAGIANKNSATQIVFFYWKSTTGQIADLHVGKIREGIGFVSGFGADCNAGFTQNSILLPGKHFPKPFEQISCQVYPGMAAGSDWPGDLRGKDVIFSPMLWVDGQTAFGFDTHGTTAAFPPFVDAELALSQKFYWLAPWIKTYTDVDYRELSIIRSIEANKENPDPNNPSDWKETVIFDGNRTEITPPPSQ